MQFLAIVATSEPRDLDLGSGQGRISIHNACSATGMPNGVAVASDSTEIWPFEIRVISRCRDV